MHRQPSILVWDAPVRVFHWLLVLSFAGAWITAESERWRLAHVTLGYTALGLVAFRALWGLVGTRHARFASFVRGPRAAWRYVAGMLRGRPEHHVGHNPAGALAIVGLLLGVLAIGATGLAAYEGLGGPLAGHWLEEAHEAVAHATLLLVGLHVAGVVVGSAAHRENLVAAMLTGRKAGPPSQAIRHAWLSVAGIMLVAVMSFWFVQWQQPSPAGLAAAGPAGVSAHAQRRSHAHDDNDD